MGLEPGSPFGQSIASVMTYLRHHHAVSYQRQSQLMGERYGVALSEWAIANLLQRVQTHLAAPVARIVERLRSARLTGCNQWEWVFQNEPVCLHVSRPSRGKAVIDETMADLEFEPQGPRGAAITQVLPNNPKAFAAVP